MGRHRDDILREYVRRVLREETEAPEIETVGDLKDAIAAATGKKREKRGKAAAKDFAKSVLMDLVPGLGTITGAAEALQAMYSMPDDKRTGTALDYLDVDDPVSAIVDDNVENRFLKAVAERLESFPDDTKLIDFDMTRQLASFLKKEFEDRTVIGFDA